MPNLNKERCVQNLKIFLQEELGMTDFDHDITVDPNINYDKPKNILKNALETCMPSKLLKYSKQT